MCKTINALQLAHYVVWHANELGHRITHLQLQKILYYIQGYHLRDFGVPLFMDKIYAWRYGPVVNKVYSQYFIFGALPLKETEQQTLQVEPEQQKLIDRVIKDKAEYRATQLVAATHKEEPWKNLEARVNAGERPEMTVESIKKYFATVR